MLYTIFYSPMLDLKTMLQVALVRLVVTPRERLALVNTVASLLGITLFNTLSANTHEENLCVDF